MLLVRRGELQSKNEDKAGYVCTCEKMLFVCMGPVMCAAVKDWGGMGAQQARLAVAGGVLIGTPVCEEGASELTWEAVVAEEDAEEDRGR